MKIKFRESELGAKRMAQLNLVNEIIEDYQDQGLTLTLRQLYYQLVVRNVIPNKATEYQKLSVLLKEGRMSGVVDWDAIEDRLRRPSRPSHWDSPYSAMDAVIQQYRNDRQEGQDTYLEVWVEKDALSGVLKRVTEPYGVPILVNRGYSSASALYDSYNRFSEAHERGQNIVVIYLGDFDPSGLDMVRDIKSRIEEFFDGVQNYEVDFEIKAVALTAAQIKQYKPPVNPAKIKDPRSGKYIAEHGKSSWEVDALEPRVLHKLLEDTILSHIDSEKYEAVLAGEKGDIVNLTRVKSLL